MLDQKVIVIPTDFSECAASAMEYGLAFANAIKAKICALHVVYPQLDAQDIPIFSATATQTKTELGKQALVSWVNKIKEKSPQKNYAHLDIETKIKVGSTANCISSYASEVNADLILMGTDGTQAIQKRMMGSLTASMINNVETPILTVPSNYNYTGIKTIAFASDYSDADPYEVWKFSQLLSPLSPIIHFVHVSSKDEDLEKSEIQLRNIEKFFKGHVPFMQMKFHNLNGEFVREQLMEFARNNDIDLLGMYHIQRPWYERIMFQSKSQDMVLHSDIPILVLME